MSGFTKLTGPNQIKSGATVVLAYRKEGQVHTVDEVLNPGTNIEEILLDAKKNLYFITSMVVSGTSWAKDVSFKN